MSACTGLEPMADRATLYNQAMADASNKQVLLNVVRASKRLPVFYTTPTAAQSEENIQTKVSVPIDVGPGAAEIFRFTNDLSPSRKDAVTIAPLDSQKFMRGVLTPITPEIFGYYFEGGWPKELLIDLAVERIEIKASALTKMVAALKRRPDADCRANVYCRTLRRQWETPGSADDNISLEAELAQCPQGKTVVANNNPLSDRELRCFEAVVRTMLAFDLQAKNEAVYQFVSDDIDQTGKSLQHLMTAVNGGFVVVKGPKKKDEDGEKGARDSYVLCKKVPALKFYAGSDVVAVLAQDEDGHPACSARMLTAKNPGSDISFVPRSPDAMIYYLGEIVRAEALGREKSAVRHAPILLWGGVDTGAGAPQFVTTRLFSVASGPALGPRAVQVWMDKVPYSISMPCIDDTACPADRRHRSMQAISFITQVLGLLKEQDKAPIYPSFTVLTN